MVDSIGPIRANAKNRLRLMLRTERIGIDRECAPRTASGESGTAKVIGRRSARILGTWSGSDRKWGRRKDGIGRVSRLMWRNYDRRW